MTKGKTTFVKNIWPAKMLVDMPFFLNWRNMRLKSFKDLLFYKIYNYLLRQIKMYEPKNSFNLMILTNVAKVNCLVNHLWNWKDSSLHDYSWNMNWILQCMQRSWIKKVWPIDLLICISWITSKSQLFYSHYYWCVCQSD